MTKRTVLTCKVIDQEGWKMVDQTFELINPFGRHGRIGGNDPEDVMVMKWSGEHGATYVFNHAYTSKYEEEVTNTATIKSSCGQEMTLKLDDIDENQDINEVTIRGVKYTPQ